jgi:predicted metal-dependent hydrolase
MWVSCGHSVENIGASLPSRARDAYRWAMSSPTVELRPSTRRTRTVTAYRQGDTVVVLVPARMSQAEQRRWAQRMVQRITAKEQRRPTGDADLLLRARELAACYLPELTGLAPLDGLEVRWSARQRARWASCTPLDRTIRVSERLRGVPGWVLDDVLVHELAHLLEVNHSPGFWLLAQRHPRHAEAVTWLDGYAAGLAALPAGTAAGPSAAAAVVMPAV